MSDKTQRDKDLEEVRKIRDENERRLASHDRTEVHREVEAQTQAGAEKAKPVEVHAFGGEVHVNSHGEAVLDHDGVIQLRKALDAAFQAVS